MSNTQRDTVAASTAAAGNSFLTLSKVYLTSVEDIAALNLKAARDALDDCAAAARNLSAPIAGKDYANSLSEFGHPMFNRAVAHSRDVCEVMTKAQEDMAAVIKAQFAYPPMGWPGIGDWNALSGMFAKGFQRLSTSAADNFAAASDASAKAIAATTSSVRKAA